MVSTSTANARGYDRHLKTLTALRWFAAAIVVLPHLYMDQMSEFWVAVFNRTSFGVMFFFMLSGFVLAWSQRADDTRWRFYRRRFARIYPLHLVTLLLAIGVIYVEGSSPNWAALPFSLTLTQAWIPTGAVYNAFNSLSWSLACEAFFYALFPFIFGPLSRLTRSRRRMLLGAILALEIVRGIIVQLGHGNETSIVGALTVSDVTHWAGYYLPAVRLLEFVAGIILALEVRDGLRVRVRLPLAATIVVAAYAILCMIPDLGLGAVDVWMFVPAFVLIAAGAARDLRPDTTPPWGWLVLLGQASFAMYLIQQLILRLVDVAAPDLFTGLLSLALPAAAAAIVLLTAASVPVHLWYEVPLERLLRPKRAAVPVQEQTPARLG